MGPCGCSTSIWCDPVHEDSSQFEPSSLSLPVSSSRQHPYCVPAQPPTKPGDGAAVGSAVGSADGWAVGATVGAAVGAVVGDAVGAAVGASGAEVGAAVGAGGGLARHVPVATPHISGQIE